MEKKELEMSFNSERHREDLTVQHISVNCLAESGLRYGEGTISASEVSSDVMDTVKQAIHSDNILVPIDRDSKGEVVNDDGCGDGRLTQSIFEGSERRKKSLNRPKIFGGGATMAVAALVGQGNSQEKNVQDLFATAIHDLADHELPFGAHTDDHAEGPNCGCGAIDKAPRIIENVGRYEQQIAEAAKLILGSEEGIQEVIDNFKQYHSKHADEAYEGAKVMEQIVEDGKIVKELTGAHKEVAIILNTVPEYTVDQQYIRSVSDDQAQVFAVDVLRLGIVANGLYPNDTEARDKAYKSMVIYTLATAGTLTKGDLPVYVLSSQEVVV